MWQNFDWMFLDCSSTQWNWRGDPRQQTIYRVLRSGWRSWRGLLVTGKCWNEANQKKEKKEEGINKTVAPRHVMNHLVSAGFSTSSCWSAAAVGGAQFAAHVLLLVAFAAMQTWNHSVCVCFLFSAPPFLFLWVHLIQSYETKMQFLTAKPQVL